MPKRNTSHPVSRVIYHQSNLKLLIRDIRLNPRLRLFAEVISVFLDINDPKIRQEFWTLINFFYIKSSNGPLIKDYGDDTETASDVDPKQEMKELWNTINQANLEIAIKDANS